MKFQFPRHLFTPLLIYDAVNEATQKKSPPAPPATSKLTQVKIKPVVDYLVTMIQSSKSDIDQSVTQISTFRLESAGNGQIIINGDLNVSQSLTTRVTAESYINDTIINNITTDVPDLIANIMVTGTPEEKDPELFLKIQTKIRDSIKQINYTKIVQNTFDRNKAKIYVTGVLEIDGNLTVNQDIITRVIAVNIIQAIIDNLVDVKINDTDVQPPDSSGSIIAFIAATLSSLCSMIICIIIIALLLSSKNKSGS